jgi:mRNA interferase MazF
MPLQASCDVQRQDLSHPYPFRVACRFEGKAGHIVVDQLRTVDRERLRKRLGTVTPATLRLVLQVLAELFEP